MRKSRASKIGLKVANDEACICIDGIGKGAGELTLSDWMIHWLEVYTRPCVGVSSHSAYYSIIHNHIAPAFSNVLLKDLNLDILQRFFNLKAVGGRADKVKDPATGELISKSGGLSTSTLSKMRMLILLALDTAVDNSLIRTNVATKVRFAKERQPEIKILTASQQKRLENAALGDGRLLSFSILIALYTGLRIGEIAALKIEDIDLEGKMLYVRRSAKRVAVQGENTKTRIIVSAPKTEKGKRRIPLPDFLVSLLKEHIEERRAYGRRIAMTNNAVDSGFLFVSRKGVGQEQNQIRKHFAMLLEKAGLEHYKFHALRHTFASRCMEAGFDIKSLSDILGHTDAKMTLRIYTHSLEDQKRKNMEKLMAIYGGPPE